MKKLSLTISILFVALTSLMAQKYITKNGHIKFFSETPIEVIEADNHQVQSALDISTGDIIFKVLIKSFEFEKALMQEHFNENYLESDQFPDATLSAKVDNLAEIDFSKAGAYETNISGDLTIHGITQQVNEQGTFTVNDDGSIDGYAMLMIRPADYDIKIPKAVVKNIAESIEVTVDISLKKL